MFQMHSLMGRVFVGKMVGLVVGMVTILLMPTYGLTMADMFGWGVLVMFVIMGAMIGLIGMFDRHPVLGMRLTWWMRGPSIGVAFMLMTVLMAYDQVYVIMQSPLVVWTGLQSPFWALVDGIIIGGIMGYLCTKLSGEGPGLPVK